MSGWLVASCTLLAASCVGAGALMLHQRVARTTGVLLVGTGLGVLIGAWMLAADATRGEARVACVIAGMVLFPASLWAYPLPRWRHPVDFCLAVLLMSPGLIATLDALDRELTPDGSTRTDITAVLGGVAVLALVAQSAWRLETAGPAERSPLVWSSLALACCALVGGTLLFLDYQDGARSLVVTLAGLSLVPFAMAVGVLRPQIIDVRGLVVRAAVFIVLAVAYVAMFVGILSVAEARGAADLSPAATALLGFILGIALRPASTLLNSVMDQMLFGDRPDPLGAASRAVGRIGDDPLDALESIRDGLALPYLALKREGQLLVESGAPVSHMRTLHLTSPSDQGSDIVVGLRPGDLRLSAGDTRALLVVAPLVLQLVRAQRLTAEVQASRSQAIATVADERRRLRRDLHDGLGPTLTGIAFATDAARNVAHSDPDAVDALLVGIRHDTTDAIAQIRTLVYGMRPPALDELGLLTAIRQQAAAIRRHDGTPLPVRFDEPEALPSLPAAIEVAAYRIVIEALTNVARHTASGTAVVRITLPSSHTLVVDVTDDAVTLPAWTPGVGIASMQERAAELGGTLSWGPTDEGGRVTAALPL